MKLLTDRAVLLCDHKLGRVAIVASQSFVTIGGRPVLVDSDPEGRPIAGCPPAPGFKPCLNTLQVNEGYSGLIGIKSCLGRRRRVCLSVVGLTDGTPPGEVNYRVASPGQSFVSEVGA